MTTVFFTSLHCRHPELECWFILEEAGAIHASFLPAEHRRGLAILQRQALAPPGGGGPYRLVSSAHQKLREGARVINRRFEAYLEGEEEDFLQPPPSPFLLAGSTFQQRVWARINRIPAGETRTYGEIGESLGSRSLARAVGRACGANPCPLLIPCHRVVAAAGPGGFSGGGTKIKEILLARERRFSAAYHKVGTW